MFSIFFNMKVYCMFSLESNEYTQHTVFNVKNRKSPKSSQICSYGIFLGTQELVRNSHGKRAISVRATENLLYIGPRSVAA